MSDWRDTARDLIASGMSVNSVSREIGKSEHAIRINLNINGALDRHNAKRIAMGKRVISPRSAPRAVVEEPEAPALLKTITLPVLNLPPAPADELAPLRRISARIRYQAAAPGVARIREIHQRMIRQGKIPGRDLISEWRA